MSASGDPAIPTGFGIQLQGAGEGVLSISFANAQEQANFMAALQRRGGRARVDLVPDQDADVEGHSLLPLADVRLRITDEDDTEGHAISIHFPSAKEADDFRRRLVLAGVLAGTVALGAVGAANIPTAQPDAGAAGAAGAASITTQAGPADMAEALGAAAASRGSIADATGPADMAEALGAAASAQSITNATGPADMAEALGAAASAQSITNATGPADMAEALGAAQSRSFESSSIVEGQGPADMAEALGAAASGTHQAGSYAPGYPEHGGLAGPTPVSEVNQAGGFASGYPQHGGLAGPSGSTVDADRTDALSAAQAASYESSTIAERGQASQGTSDDDATDRPEGRGITNR
jgi:hypothetical protein